MSEGNSVLEKDQVLRVSPELLMGSGLNPRKVFSPVKLQEMARSILVKGVVVPLMVRELPEPSASGALYEVIMGETRLRAATMVQAGFTDTEGSTVAGSPDLTIPIMINNVPDDAVIELMMTENVMRNDLRPSEEAHGYHDMMVRGGLSAREVAERLSVDRRRVDRHLLFLDLPNETIDRIDANELPMYVAQEALKVPADWLGGDARMDALKLAEEAGSQDRAAALIEARWLRPVRERMRWESEESVAAIREEFGGEVQILDYTVSRELFLPGTTLLTPVTAKGYVAGHLVPESPEVRRAVDMSWMELAQKYGAPVYVACDGAMNAVPLVRRVLVEDAARVAHTHEVELIPGDEMAQAHFVSEYLAEEGDEMALMVMSHDGRLPRPLSVGEIYYAREVTDEGSIRSFELVSSRDAVSPIGLEDEGAGSGDGEHPLRMALLDLERCPFGPVGGAVSVASGKVDAVRSQESESEVNRERVAKVTELLGLAALAVRAEVEKSGGSDEMLAKTCRFLITCGAFGLPPEEHPANLLMLALEVREEEEGEGLFEGWEGIAETRAGIESFCVCGWLLYFMDTYEGEDVTACPQWREVKAVYGV